MIARAVEIRATCVRAYGNSIETEQGAEDKFTGKSQTAGLDGGSSLSAPEEKNWDL
jgi:hypothetical protein